MLPSPHPSALFRNTSEGAVLLQMDEEIYFGLNSVGAKVWELLPPECKDLDELCDRLAGDYPDVDRETLRRDISELLESLEENGLVMSASGEES